MNPEDSTRIAHRARTWAQTGACGDHTNIHHNEIVAIIRDFDKSRDRLDRSAAEWATVPRQAGTILLVAEPSALSLGMIGHHIAGAAPAGVDCSRIHILMNRWRQNDNDALAAF